MKIMASIALAWLVAATASAAPDDIPVPAAGERPAEYLNLSVDRVVVDSDGLAMAAATLAGSVDRLGLAIAQLSENSASFSDEDREILLRAVQSVGEASTALTQLARQLPQTAQDLSERLPQIINDARAPLAELSTGLQSARDSIYMITESLPQATENSKELVNATLDAALQRLIFYSVALAAIVALALIGIMWFVYRNYIAPLTRKLEQLVGAPEYLESMARHMSETSANLARIEDIRARGEHRGAARYLRH